MTIEVEQIKKLIEDYRRSARVCMESGSGPVASGQASVWRMVIGGLEALLPRRSLADFHSDEWPQFVGAWVEHDGVKRIISDVDTVFGESPIDLFCPRTRGAYFAEPNKVYPLDGFSRVWDSEGNPL